MRTFHLRVWECGDMLSNNHRCPDFSSGPASHQIAKLSLLVHTCARVCVIEEVWNMARFVFFNNKYFGHDEPSFSKQKSDEAARSFLESKQQVCAGRACELGARSSKVSKLLRGMFIQRRGQTSSFSSNMRVPNLAW